MLRKSVRAARPAPVLLDRHSYHGGIVDTAGRFVIRSGKRGGVEVTVRLPARVAEAFQDRWGGVYHRGRWTCPPSQQLEFIDAFLPVLEIQREAASRVMRWRLTSPKRAFGWRVTSGVSAFRERLTMYGDAD